MLLVEPSKQSKRETIQTGDSGFQTHESRGRRGGGGYTTPSLFLWSGTMTFAIRLYWGKMCFSTGKSQVAANTAEGSKWYDPQNSTKPANIQQKEKKRQACLSCLSEWCFQAVTMCPCEDDGRVNAHVAWVCCCFLGTKFSTSQGKVRWRENYLARREHTCMESSRWATAGK